MLLVWTYKRTPDLRADLFVPIMTVTLEIELQVPPTPQLVKRGRGSYLYRPYGSRDDSWLPGVSRNLCPVFGTIQVLGKENIQPDFLEVRLAEV